MAASPEPSVTVSELLEAIAAAHALNGADVEAHSVEDESTANLNFGCTVIEL